MSKQTKPDSSATRQADGSLGGAAGSKPLRRSPLALLGAVGRSVLYAVDDAWCTLTLALRGDRPGLLGFMFHSVCADGAESEIDRCVDPAQTLPVSSIATFLEYFLENGYRFVSPDEVVRGLDPGGRYALLTFDDGYYNNVRVLPTLHQYQVPALFSVSTGHVTEGKAFWWDIVHRERTRRGVSRASIEEEQRTLKTLQHGEIEHYLAREFGADALRPAGDEDRPLSVNELAAFSADPLVHIGNHTRDHVILTTCSADEASAQIGRAQDDLEAITGHRPLAIAYPNGGYSREVIEATTRNGLKLGLTVEPERGCTPTTQDERYKIGRFCFTRGHDRPRTYRGYRSTMSLRRLASAVVS